MPPPHTLHVRDAEDVRRFFDALADEYRDSHGHAGRLLRDRLALIRALLRGAGRSCLVEIGCGNGLHLFPLAHDFDHVVGTDLSPRMIAAAERQRAGHSRGAHIRLAAHAAERLSSVADASADAVLCVGAFEHMLDPRAVLKEVGRVLRPGGAFVCLAPNGGCLWYTHFAPFLGLRTRHLSTDRFMGPAEWRARLIESDLHALVIGTWRFVPAGDMPAWAAAAMSLLDRIGRALRIATFRGGVYVKAVKPAFASREYRADARSFRAPLARFQRSAPCTNTQDAAR
jgi:2-polyprenyl-6-hydroxyphenyl methylase/3-demethylubiquinone-9 3-methyltransferase